MAWITSALRSRGSQWGRQICNGKILTCITHWLSEPTVDDVAEPVEAAVDKQHGLAQPSSIGSSVSVSNVGAIVQVPGVAWLESGNAERFDQGGKISWWPERGIRLHRWGVMRQTKPTSVARNERGAVDLAY